MGFCFAVRSGGIPVCFALCLLVLAPNIIRASSSSSGSGDSRASSVSSFTCDQVRELFEGGIGYQTALHSQPEHESELSLCRRGGARGEYSCCSVDTENGLGEVVEKKLKQNVHVRNGALKKRLKNIMAGYQERLRQLNAEAENRTAAFLSRLHKIPWGEHRSLVAKLYSGLQTLVTRGPAEPGRRGDVEELVRDFFVNLFPSVFSYVLSAREPGEERRPIGADYHECLKRYADQIQPFGNQPERLLRHLRRSIQHARAFQDTLATLVEAMTSTENATLDVSCRRALVRLQVCPGCRGVSVQTPAVKSCRGLCLNVMRGCLAKMSEVSSSWDDLLVAFENLQVGMQGHYDLQKTLIYLDMNVSDAIMMAMDDSPRIYDEVRVKCQDVPRASSDPSSSSSSSSSTSTSAPLPLLPEGYDDVITQAAIAPRNTQALRDFRQELRSVVRSLEDSKGRFNRLPDSLCEDDQVYGQDMMSSECWNGTTVGRYMEQVPEANFLSQVQRNKEVKVSLVDPDFRFLQVKESLTHMRQNLSGLLNREIMQGDSPYGNYPTPYKSLDQEGSGRMYHQDVIVDDEDLVAYGSGSGSGSGAGPNLDEDTPKPDDPFITRTPTRPPSSASTLTLSTLLMPLGLCLQRLLH
ncbi:hypothetical protein ACOMHN_015407 [Nucella lapillus]